MKIFEGTPRQHWKYLAYVVRHKWFVFWACADLGILWRGLVHDLGKLRLSEWRLRYANPQKALDVHKARNRHHQYDQTLTQEEIKEVAADWVGAAQTRGNDAVEWITNKGLWLSVHPANSVLLGQALDQLLGR